MTDGVPRIRKLCRELGIRNTFFVNMGRSTNLREWMGRGFARSRQKWSDKESINLIQKAGWSRFLLESVLGRPVGLSFVPELRQLLDEGHELGLHGGMDHVLWSRRFIELPSEELERDVRRSYEHFTRNFGRPQGFTSPGFQSDERVLALLESLGFKYNGDGIGGVPSRVTSRGLEFKQWTIPVTLTGSGTIPFLEWHRARRSPEADIVAALDRHLEANRIVIVYGHPCFEGVHVDLLQRVFQRVLRHGFRFVTHSDILEVLETSPAHTTSELCI
jgi:peptidoglycan/xylan/chitin deacetylase (PgdA/CDA1 family)